MKPQLCTSNQENSRNQSRKHENNKEKKRNFVLIKETQDQQIKTHIKKTSSNTNNGILAFMYVRRTSAYKTPIMHFHTNKKIQETNQKNMKKKGNFLPTKETRDQNTKTHFKKPQRNI